MSSTQTSTFVVHLSSILSAVLMLHTQYFFRGVLFTIVLHGNILTFMRLHTWHLAYATSNEIGGVVSKRPRMIKFKRCLDNIAGRTLFLQYRNIWDDIRCSYNMMHPCVLLGFHSCCIHEQSMETDKRHQSEPNFVTIEAIDGLSKGGA